MFDRRVRVARSRKGRDREGSRCGLWGKDGRGGDRRRRKVMMLIQIDKIKMKIGQGRKGRKKVEDMFPGEFRREYDGQSL